MKGNDQVSEKVLLASVYAIKLLKKEWKDIGDLFTGRIELRIVHGPTL